MFTVFIMAIISSLITGVLFKWTGFMVVCALALIGVVIHTVWGCRK